MNKHEFIERVKELTLFSKEYLKVKLIDRDDVIKLIEQLNVPEKPVVPQFVADWYEKHKYDLEYDIWEYILHWGKQQKSEFYEWMNHANNKPFQTLANMHQFGYTVEEEKRYRVKMKGNVSENILVFGLVTQVYFFSKDNHNNKYRQTTHTRKELERSGFGWVFDCPGVEVTEVE